MKRETLTKILTIKGIVIVIASLVAMSIIPTYSSSSTQQLSTDEWWKASWHYRFKLIVNSTKYERVDWPIEYEVNFTSLLHSLGVNGTFDLNSPRVFEYDSEGNFLYEVPSQFDVDEDFNASTNAVGTLVFLLNGSTPANAKRYFYVYFDILENGQKSEPNYPTNLSYSWDGRFIEVNTSKMRIFIDTNKSEHTSGIYKVIIGDTTIFDTPENERTMEYINYFNGSHNLTSYLAGNATFIEGPVRLTIKQVGDEIVFGSDQPTGEGKFVKKYYIYNRAGSGIAGSWIKIEHTFKNDATFSITRNSTPAGALALDVDRSFYFGVDAYDGNVTDPYSWYLAIEATTTNVVGVINLNESGANYFATNSTAWGRIGIELNTVSLNPGDAISETALVYFGKGGTIPTASDEFRDIVDRFKTPIEIQALAPEKWKVRVKAATDKPIYNRGESLFIYGNVTYDPTSLVAKMNATLDMGTLDLSDDQTIVLYDDGTHGDAVAGDKIFTNYFNLTPTANLGVWNVTIKAYDAEGYLLNQTWVTFNVTNVYRVNVTILNPTGLTERPINVTIQVKNYLGDTWISGATINCSYDGVFVDNYTDYSNGTYSLTFQAPSTPGVYVLNCSANRTNNFGWDTDTFTAESTTSNVSIEVSPTNFTATNITWYKNQSFELIVNTTNVGNVTAFDVNFTLTLPAGWSANSTLEPCGDIGVGESCTKAFKVTVAEATPPGNYLVNVTVVWRNYDGSVGTNETSVNVTVTPNPILEIPEEIVSNWVVAGEERTVGNFTLNSTGNDALLDVNFEVIGLEDFTIEFLPSSLTSLDAGKTQSVQINVSVPSNYPTGVYRGTINVTTSNDGWDNLTLEIIVSGTNLTIEVSPTNFTATNITWYKNQSFELIVNTTNVGNVTAFDVNFTLTLPAGWSANSTLEPCGDIGVGESCTKAFKVTVAEATPPGNYLVNVTVVWRNYDGSVGTNETSVNVTVTPNPILEIPEEIVSNSIAPGTEGILGNFTLNSTGNDALLNITFVLTGLEDFDVEFIPSGVSTLGAGKVQSIQINVSVPAGYPAGTYYGSVNVTTSNDGWDNLTLEVIVPISRTWTLQPEYCEKIEIPDWGIVCEVNVTNTGNDIINFTITPPRANYTWVNETSFYVPKQATHTFSVWYNVSGVPKDFYNATYNITAIQPAQPAYRLLTVSLLPFIPPTINVSIHPKKADQLSYFEIYANVTDNVGYGINFTEVTVIRPDGTADKKNMTNVFIIGDLSTWYARYPDGWGNTSLRGNYTVIVRARDNLGVENEVEDWFTVFVKPSINVTTYSKEYYQGDTATIFFEAKDALDEPLTNANVTILIKTPSGKIVFNETYKTNSMGRIEPLPTYSIPTDAEVGTYNLSCVLRYFDPSANEDVRVENETTFTVVEMVVGGLFVDIEGSFSYTEKFMKFWISTYDAAGSPVNVDELNLTVLDPNDNTLFSTNVSDVERKDEGLYFYRHNLTGNELEGDYLVIVRVRKGGFEAQTTKTFTLTKKGIIASIETQVVWYPENTMTFIIHVYDESYAPVDPDEMNLTVYVGSPLLNNVYLVSNLSDPRMQKVENGSYVLSYVMPADTPSGDYWAILRVRKDTLYTITEKPFRVSKGGPYDVRIELIDTEVYREDFLDFYIIIENKGEVSQDVDLEYWVSGFNQTWYYASEAVYVPAFSNKTLLRSVYIFSTQPIGKYWLNVKVTYDVTQPPIIKNVTFSVIEKVVPTIPRAPMPVAPPPAAPPGVPKILIVEYPYEISLVAGWTKYPSVKVKNVGEVDLYEVELVLSGLPSQWFSVTPKKIDVLHVNETGTFTVSISVPKGEKAKEYIVRLIALSNQTKDEKTMLLRVFTSLEELIKFELRKLEIEFRKLKLEKKQAEDAGKDVSDCLPLIEEVGHQIDLAKSALKERRYDDALKNIDTGWSLIERARECLAQAPFVRPLIVPVIPTWIFLVVVALFMVITLLLVFTRRLRRLLRSIFERKAVEMTRIKEIVTPKEERKLLEEERDRIRRALDLLRREYEEGIISDATYAELRRANEERLKRIEERLRKI